MIDYTLLDATYIAGKVGVCTTMQLSMLLDVVLPVYVWSHSATKHTHERI